MKHGLRFLFVLGFVILVLSACDPGPCTPTLTFEPELTAPPNNSRVDALRPVLSWTYVEVCDPDEYWINLWTNSTNGTITATGFGGATGDPSKSWSPPSDLVVGTAYLWQVAAKNATLTGPYSDMWQFVVGPACDTPALIAPTTEMPIDGDTVTTTDPTYTWEYSDPACTPDGYYLQVSSAADFSVLEVDLRDFNPLKGWVTGILLDDCETYYWRVAAIHGTDDGPWSTVSEFYINTSGTCICELAGLVQPIPIWPGSLEIVPDLRPRLEWSFPGDCVVGGFAVHLSTEADMSDTSLFGGTGNPSTNWAPGPDLELATRYWWEVAAGVDADLGPFSAKRSFFTGPECSSPADLVAPVLLSPDHDAVITEEYAILRFMRGDPPCLPDGYLIELQTDPTFSGTNLLLPDGYDFPGSGLITDALPDCTRFYWKVAAKQDGAFGPFSETREFRTNQSGTCMYVSMASPLFDIACRFGAHFDHEIIGYILQEEETEVFAKSMDGKWLAVQNPDSVKGDHCWVPLKDVVFKGDLTEFSIWTSPLLPTPVPVCNESIPTEKECVAAGGVWTISSTTPLNLSYYCECD